jgi:hypothetical protein
MEQPRAPDGCGRLADPPRDVEVTIIRAPERRAAGAGARLPARALVTVALMLAAAVAVLSTSGGPRVDRPHTAPAIRFAATDAASLPAAAAVYRYPLGCLGASLSGDATASRDGPCWRYGVFLTAVIHRAGGGWRLGLEAVSPRCPRISLPAALRAQLVACRR